MTASRKTTTTALDRLRELEQAARAIDAEPAFHGRPSWTPSELRTRPRRR